MAMSDSQLTDPTTCAINYLYVQSGYAQEGDVRKRNATYFECTTCLTDRNNEPGIGPDVLRGIPSENLTKIGNLLIRFSAFERVFAYYAPAPEGYYLYGREYSRRDKLAHFSNYLQTVISEGQSKFTVTLEDELWVANLVARIPLLAILGAETKLPKTTRDPGASEQLVVNTALEVRWNRAIAVLVSILVGQLLAIIVVTFGCREILLRDHDSYLSIARLLRTLIDQVDGRSAEKGEELAKVLGEEKVRYGTKLSRENPSVYEVDLSNDVREVFEFPRGEYS
ncbi:hypothetical protein ABW19_dt0207094 [Dactylella cylindrospora]|nr:hypothetical protein ABW19_dt0207094 [Dactylella cylindrospora]